MAALRKGAVSYEGGTTVWCRVEVVGTPVTPNPRRPGVGGGSECLLLKMAGSMPGGYGSGGHAELLSRQRDGVKVGVPPAANDVFLY